MSLELLRNIAVNATNGGAIPVEVEQADLAMPKLPWEKSVANKTDNVVAEASSSSDTYHETMTLGSGVAQETQQAIAETVPGGFVERLAQERGMTPEELHTQEQARESHIAALLVRQRREKTEGYSGPAFRPFV